MSTLRRRFARSQFSFLAVLLILALAGSAYGQTASLGNAPRSFGNVAVGSSSAASTITLRNTSTTVALAISSVAVTGDYAQTNTCGASVAARGSCVITLTFTPTATGTRTGTLTISDNATPATQSANLTGTGVAPVTLTPASRAFGNQGVGSASAVKTFTVTNNTSAALSFTVTTAAPFSETDTCSSVKANSACTISAAFSPTATGAASGTISVAYSGGSPLSLAVTGTGVAPITLNPTSRSFGNIGVGSVSATKTFTVQNNGTSAMALTITPSAGFTETDNCASLAGSASCTINAVFAPTATGAVTGSIGVSYSGLGSPLSASVTGTGIAPVTLTPASQAFGNVALGTTSAAKTFTVSNKGTAAQALTVGLSAGFNQTNTCGSSLAGGATCTISVTFAPTTAAAATGTVSVSSASLVTPLTSTVSATGVAPVTLTPTTLAFSTTQKVGAATAAKTVTVKNAGTAALAIQSIVTAPADYAQTNNCGTSLAGGKSCTINVVFTPATAASIPGTLTISDSALGSPQVVSLSGTGTLANIRSVAITPATVSIPKGTTLQLTATATYQNGTTGNVTTLSTWTSVNPAIVSVSATGLATGVATGSTSITALVTGTTVSVSKAATTAPPALTALALSPTSASIAPGATQGYTVMATYSDASTAPMTAGLTFSSANTGVATVSNGGMATGINGGSTNIMATSGKVSSPMVPLTVTGPTLQSITISPNAPSILKGSTQQFTAIGNYSDASSKDLTALVVWSSGNANLTIVPNTGLATGVTAGPASVTASWTGGVVTGSMTATVASSSLISIAVSPLSISVGLGAQQQYTASGTFSDNSVQDISNQVTWISGNLSVVGMTTGGMATVLGTSSSGIPISASMNGVTSNPPAFLNALASLPRVCPDASLDMKVLVVAKTTAGYVDLAGIKQILDFVGTPYTVMDNAAVTPAVLSDGACHGYYQAIIMAFANDIYDPAAPTLWPTLNSYEQTFHVRQVNWYLNPTPDYGFNYSPAQIQATQTYTANFTPAAATVFPNINTATPLSISGAFIYLSPPYTPPSGTVTPLLIDGSGNVLSAIYAPGNGIEVLSQTFDSNQYLMHNLVLAYGLLNWATKGVFLGDYHVYAAAQVDDFFISDAEWKPGTSCTDPITHDRTVSDAPILGTFRLNAADMTSLVAWQNGLQNDPLLKGFKLSLAFNGVGTTGNKDWTGVSATGIGPAPADDLTFTLPSYEKFFHWMTHTYDHPNTLNGLDKSDGLGDLDNHPGIDSIDLEILTNLFVASGTTQNGVNLDTDSSDNPPLGAVTTLNFTDFNPGNMVSPGVTGLNDPVVPVYLYTDGIRYVVTDTSVIGQTNNGPNPSPNVGMPNSFAPGIYEVPRYPNNVYYNAANWADDQAEFHCIYGPDPGPEDTTYGNYQAADILNYTSGIFVVNMLKGDMDPQMFHQPNLHFQDNAAALGLGTTHFSSLISDTYNQTFAKYEAVYKLPVLSLTLDQLGEAMKARNAYNLAGASGTLTGVGTASPSVTITVPAANPGAIIPVTGLTSNGSELYGSTPISHIQLGAGQSITLQLK